MDRVTLLLTFKVTIEKNGALEDDLISNFHYMVSKTHTEGVVTNGTAAEIVNHNAEVLIADNKLSF